MSSTIAKTLVLPQQGLGAGQLSGIENELPIFTTRKRKADLNLNGDKRRGFENGTYYPIGLIENLEVGFTQGTSFKFTAAVSFTARSGFVEACSRRADRDGWPTCHLLSSFLKNFLVFNHCIIHIKPEVMGKMNDICKLLNTNSEAPGSDEESENETESGSDGEVEDTQAFEED